MGHFSGILSGTIDHRFLYLREAKKRFEQAKRTADDARRRGCATAESLLNDAVVSMNAGFDILEKNGLRGEQFDELTVDAWDSVMHAAQVIERRCGSSAANDDLGAMRRPR